MHRNLVRMLAVGAIAAMTLAACGSNSSDGNADGDDTASTQQSTGDSPQTDDDASDGDTSAEGDDGADGSTDATDDAQDDDMVGPAPEFPNEKLTDEAFTIALMLPEHTSTRYEDKDRPYFEEALSIICPNCEMLYANADNDPAAQQEQANSFITQGADVLVVDPLDGVAAASIVQAGMVSNVPVIAYDRLISSPDVAYVVSNNYFKVGQLQAQALLDKLDADGVTPDDGGIIMINGATTDNNAGNIKRGAHSILDESGFEILSDVDTWDPAEARTWVDGQITRFGDSIVGVYSANDANAASSIAAFAAAGLPMVPVTGLDASAQGLQNIIAGKQYMTTYNAFKSEAEGAAVAAISLALGEEPPSNGTVDGHPALLNEPIAVTVDNIMDTVIADDFWTVSDLCTPEYADACADAGIQ